MWKRDVLPLLPGGRRCTLALYEREIVMNNSNVLSRYWPAAAGLLLAAVVVSALQSPAPLSQGPASAALDSYGATAKRKFDIKEVSLPEAKALIDGGALVIDVRYQAVSAAAHIAGALLIPLEALPARMAEIESAKALPIVVYCGDGSTLGPEAAHLLTQAGFTQVVNLKPGFSGWREAGLPVKSS